MVEQPLFFNIVRWKRRGWRNSGRVGVHFCGDGDGMVVMVLLSISCCAHRVAIETWKRDIEAKLRILGPCFGKINRIISDWCGTLLTSAGACHRGIDGRRVRNRVPAGSSGRDKFTHSMNPFRARTTFGESPIVARNVTTRLTINHNPTEDYPVDLVVGTKSSNPSPVRDRSIESENQTKAAQRLWTDSADRRTHGRCHNRPLG